jgi:hypothetical protein
MKITPVPAIPVPQARYINHGVTLGWKEHSDRVRDIERSACLDFWNKSGAFKVIKIDNLVLQSTGSSQMLMLNQTDVKIDVFQDHQWKDHTGVRHSHIEYSMSYSYTGQIIDFAGDGAVPKDIEKIPTGIVPGKTEWG